MLVDYFLGCTVCRGVKGMYRDGNYNNGENVDYFYNTGSP